MNAQSVILVTGGAGYIGSHACKALAHAGFTPVVYDSLSLGHREFVKWGPLVEGDMRDRASLVAAMKQYKPVGVMHFAALSSVGESVGKPLDYYDVNLTGTQTILSAMKECGVEFIILSSTAAVYGTPASVPISENTPTMPENPYGRSKLLAEMVMRDCEKAYGLNWMALRYFNACGASPAGDIGESHNPETHLIPLALAAAAGDAPALSIFGNDWPTPDGTCIRDYIHVTDLADAHVKALQYLMKEKVSGPVNLGIGKGYSVLEIIEAIKTVTKREVPAKMAPRRAGDVSTLVADASRARDILGFKPEHSSLEHIIQTAWDWYNRRPNQ